MISNQTKINKNKENEKIVKLTQEPKDQVLFLKS